MKINIELTWSKILAFLILGISTALSFIHKDSEIFTYSLTFVAGILLGKQGFDMGKQLKTTKNNQIQPDGK